MQITAYLTFHGKAEEAIGFYGQALGARLEMLMRFNEAPQAPPPGMLPPDWGHKVMHASITVGDQRIMMSDGGCQNDGTGFQGFALSVAVPDIAEADRIFAALSDGGTVTMPQAATFWSPRFGMLTDRYGVAWMVMVTPPM